MKTVLGFVGAAALAIGLAGPALAQVDVAAMTCGDYFGLDSAGQIAAFGAVKVFVAESANAAVAGSTAQMSDDQLKGAIATGCEGQDVTTNLLAAMQK